MCVCVDIIGYTTNVLVREAWVYLSYQSIRCLAVLKFLCLLVSVPLVYYRHVFVSHLDTSFVFFLSFSPSLTHSLSFSLTTSFFCLLLRRLPYAARQFLFYSSGLQNKLLFFFYSSFLSFRVFCCSFSPFPDGTADFSKPMLLATALVSFSWSLAQGAFVNIVVGAICSIRYIPTYVLYVYFIFLFHFFPSSFSS